MVAAQYLVDRLLLARKSKIQFFAQFEELCATTSPSLIACWELLSTQPQISSNGKNVTSVYFNDFDKGGYAIYPAHVAKRLMIS